MKLSTTIEVDLLSLRPANLRLCPDAQFELFCNAAAAVFHGEPLETPLHETIAAALATFIEDESLSLNELKRCLSFIAESAHLLTGNQLSKGSLTHIWLIEKHDIHPWVEEFAVTCAPHADHIPSPSLPHLKQASTIERLQTVGDWAEYLQTQSTQDQDADNEDESVRSVTIERNTFKRFVTVTCSKIYEDIDFVSLNLRDIGPGEIELTLSWDTALGAPHPCFGIDQRIAEAYRLDEAASAENTKPEDYPYTLLIKTADAA